MMTRLLFTLAASAAGLAPLAAADWPQYRGPDRDGVSKETGLLKTWPKAGPPLAWTFTNAGVGYSGPAVVGDRLYLMGARGDTEYLFALDIAARPVKEVWAVKIGPKFGWKDNSWNAGPSATPTVADGLVYGLGGQGILVCADAATGAEHWRKNLPADMGAEVNPEGGGEDKIGWGFTWSPLIDGPALVCVPGGPQGTVAGLDRKTGAVLWRSKELTDQATYASPVVADIQGVRQYVVLTNEGISGVAAKDGRLLWRDRRKKPYDDVVINTPIVHGNYVYATVIKSFCDLIKIDRSGDKLAAVKVYANKVMNCQNGGVVLVKDHVYGYSNGPGWVCQEFLSGKRVWSARRPASGSVIVAEGNLYLYGDEEGEVSLAPADPAGLKVKSRFTIPQKSSRNLPSGRLWTHPVIANGKLYLRDQDLLFCYDIAEKK